jgi:hypothetical protein
VPVTNEPISGVMLPDANDDPEGSEGSINGRFVSGANEEGVAISSILGCAKVKHHIKKMTNKGHFWNNMNETNEKQTKLKQFLLRTDKST